MTKKKKLNSYVKIIFALLGGGVIGAVLGIAMKSSEQGVGTVFNDMIGWIAANKVILLAVMTVLSLLSCVICYRKGGSIIEKFHPGMDDDEEEMLEEQYNTWQTLGIMLSDIFIYLSLGVFAFGLGIGSKSEAARVLYAAAFLLMTAFICVMYQVATVKQVQKKDPTKRGDAGDISFAKEWLESCDEAERRIIHEAGYKTFRLMKTVLMFAVVAAMIGELHFSTGLMAVVLLTGCNILNTVCYTYYSMRLERTGVR